MNNCTFSGNLGQDPEEKDSKNGSFVTFSLAVRQSNSDEPLWVRCASFNEGLNDKVIKKYLEKGSAVVVSGEISLFEGDKSASLQLNVRQLSFGGKGDNKPAAKSKRRDDDDDDRKAKRRRDDDDDDRRRSKGRDDDDDRKSKRRRDDDLDDEIPF